MPPILTVNDRPNGAMLQAKRIAKLTLGSAGGESRPNLCHLQLCNTGSPVRGSTRLPCFDIAIFDIFELRRNA
jgi:hypothetical protein